MGYAPNTKLRPRQDVNHHIHRLDTEKERIHTWRVQIRRRGETVMRHFPDQSHGGKRAALQAARAFRDKTLKSVNQTSYKLWNDTRLRKNNTSGVAGVARYAPLVQVGGGWVARPLWHAYWVDAEGNKKSRKFSVDKYGEASAKRRAIMARRMAISERRGQKRLSKTG